MKLILASGSPHRAKILNEFGIKYIMHPTNIPEIIKDSLPVDEVAADLARQKALAAWDDFSNDLVLGADTIVINSSGELLRKPQSSQEASTYLDNRSSSYEEVITGFYLRHPAGWMGGSESTMITYNEIPADIKKEVLSSGEWQGVCGGLKVEGTIAPYVKEIKGSAYNVRGLPIETLMPLIKKILQDSK